jgi:hypothetical protein
MDTHIFISHLGLLFSTMITYFVTKIALSKLINEVDTEEGKTVKNHFSC